MRTEDAMRNLAIFGAVLLALSLPAAGSAQERSEARPESRGILALLPSPATSEHSVAVAGRTLDYEAQAGTVALLDGSGAETAKVFYVAYSAKPGGGAGPGAPARPVTSVFNGGPGAASAYLNLGALGPRLLVTSAAGEFLPPPQQLADNPDTWLDVTDLVFVDPPETGYSRVAPGQDAKSSWGVDQDASAMGTFIRLYLLQANRMSSPVFLAGESYGGFRAALLAKTLQQDIGIMPRGLVLISPALEFSFLQPDEFEPLHWSFELPAMAAVELNRQGVRGPDFGARLAEVEEYALSDYLVATASGLEAGRDAASGAVARFTGLPIELVRQHFGRVPLPVFAKEFDRAEGKVLSRYDGTVTTADIAPKSDRPGTPDPILDRSVPVVTAAFVDYVRNELNYRTDISYRLLNGEAARSWDYGNSPTRQGYAGVLDALQEARALNPALQVLIAHGYTDLITPYMMSRYLVRQLPTLPGAKPIVMRVYEGGHMMYLRPASRAALKHDVAALYSAAETPGPDPAPAP